MDARAISAAERDGAKVIRAKQRKNINRAQITLNCFIAQYACYIYTIHLSHGIY